MGAKVLALFTHRLHLVTRGEISLFKLLFSSLSKGNDVAMEKAHKDVGFALITLSKQAQDQEERGHQAWPRRWQVRGTVASVRGTVAVLGGRHVSTRQACAIMRRLVECKMTKLPLDPAISLPEMTKIPSPTLAINTRHAAAERVSEFSWYPLRKAALLCACLPIASAALTSCMRTRSQVRNRNRRQQQLTTVIVEEPEFPMADNRTMAQMLQAPIEGYEDAIVVPLINLVQASTNAPLSTSTPSNSFEFQQLAASLEDKMNIRMSRLEKAISEKNATTPATVKAVEEVCVTCGSNHNFNNCPLTRNDFPVFHDNIHQFQQTAAVGNFVQRNPPNLANQMRPPGFNQSNVQNNQGNQNRYSNQNRGGNFNQNHQGQVFQSPTNQPPVYQVPPYQAPTPQIQGVSKTDFENYVKANDAVLKNVQNQGQNLQNQMANVTSLLTSLCNNFKNSASTSNSGTLPSQTVTNPRQQINAITTRSGKTLEEPSTPLVPTPVISIPQNEPKQNPETSTEKVQNPNLENTAHVPSPEEEESIFMEIPKPKAKKTIKLILILQPNTYQLNFQILKRMGRVRENDKPSAQHSRFLKMFKQLRLEIGLKDALVEMPKFNKWLSSLLRNKEKLEEIAITTVNAECSAIIMNKVPEKLEDPGKFLIPCALQELDRTSALADSGASINLLPHSIYKKLGLEALTPTRMTLELANRSITHPMGIAEDVVVRVDGFTFLADFVVVNFEPDLRVPIILGRPFLRTAKALIDLYEETLTLRVGKEELVYYADKSEKNKNKHCAHAISVIDFSKDDPFSGSTTTHSDDPSPSSSPVKTSDNFEKFADELAPLDSATTVNSNPLFEFDDNFKSSTINPLFDEMEEDVEIKNSNISDEPVLLNKPLSDKVECFAPEDNNDEIDDFLAMEVDDASHNLASDVTSDHEPEQNKSSITFSPRSDPLHHEFAGEFLTHPARNDRKFEEYLSLMTVLCEISTSQSQGNVHANQSSVIESLPVSPIPVENSEPTQEEIDIFLVPDDLIPPGVENDDSEDEFNKLPNLDHQDDPSIPRLPPKPPDIKKCFKPEAGILIIKEFKGVSKPHDFMADILPTLPTLVSNLTFISSFFSFESEDTIFDPGIVTFLESVAFSMAVSCSKYCSP
ncbi:reverse transcriptase domain-containing protein [Tanacetum coccineum]